MITNSRSRPYSPCDARFTMRGMKFAMEGMSLTSRSSTFAHSGGSTTPVDMKGE